MRSLQCARAFAALLVVYFHTVLQVGRLAAPAVAAPPLFGRSGVDVFFVLSGFIIWTAAAGRPTTAGDFLARRFLRIAPLYWLVTGSAALVALVAPSLLASTRFGAGHVLASLLFVPYPNPASTGSAADLMTPVIVPGWTLNFEMMFYGLFALALVAGERFRRIAVATVFALALLAAALLHGRSATLDFYDPLLVAEFLAGVVLGVLAERGTSPPPAVALGVLALGVLALVGLDALDLPAHRLFTAGLPAVLLIAAAVGIERRGRWPRAHLAVALGDASFSLYLTHVFVLAGMRIAAQRLGLTLPGAASQWAFVAVAMVASCLVGLATWRWVERPLGRFASRLLSRRPAVAPRWTAAASG